MTFSSPNFESYLGRVRHRATSLVWPLLALFLAASIVSYFANKRFEVWQLNVAYSVALLIAIVFWLIPTIRHLSFYIDLTSTRIVVRRGLFGGQTVDLAWAEISSIEQRGSKITLNSLKLSGPLELHRMPRAKALAALMRDNASSLLRQ